MRIVVENGSYHMDNLGDVAMLQVCVGRIRQRWPDADVLVVGETPGRLRDALPGARPLAPAHGHRIPMTTRVRNPRVEAGERWLQLRVPRVAHALKRRQIAHEPDACRAYDAFHDAIRSANAVICSGGGFVNDHHAEHGDKVMHSLGIAQGLGLPTAMFGAGLGPLSNERTVALAADVVGRLDVLGLREEAGNRRELAAWGARPRATLVTGDDAVALAVGTPLSDGAPGTAPDGGPAEAAGASVAALGVSLRFAREYGLPEAPGLKAAVREAAGVLGAPLTGLPVRARGAPEDDVEALATLLGPDALDLRDAAAIRTPRDLVAGVRRCRVVLTGTYHAGVFALAQGIPVVTLSGSAYYDRKFAGLAEQFEGAAVRMLRYDDPALRPKMEAALVELWRDDEDRSGALRAAARRQVEAGREAYARFFTLLERGSPARRR